MGWTVDDIIAEAGRLPLRDAAYMIWRQKPTFERLEGRRREPRDMSTAEARDRSMFELGTVKGTGESTAK